MKYVDYAINWDPCVACHRKPNNKVNIIYNVAWKSEMLLLGYCSDIIAFYFFFLYVVKSQYIF